MKNKFNVNLKVVLKIPVLLIFLKHRTYPGPIHASFRKKKYLYWVFNLLRYRFNLWWLQHQSNVSWQNAYYSFHLPGWLSFPDWIFGKKGKSFPQLKIIIYYKQYVFPICHSLKIMNENSIETSLKLEKFCSSSRSQRHLKCLFFLLKTIFTWCRQYIIPQNHLNLV